MDYSRNLLDSKAQILLLNPHISYLPISLLSSASAPSNEIPPPDNHKNRFVGLQQPIL